jgi:hypothetical protein
MRQLEAEALETYRAVARALVQFSARGPGSGPDALKAAVGQRDAELILRAAGMDAAEISRGWAQGDPDHDPRFLEVLMRRGVSDAELNRVRAEVHEEYAE